MHDLASEGSHLSSIEVMMRAHHDFYASFRSASLVRHPLDHWPRRAALYCVDHRGLDRRRSRVYLGQAGVYRTSMSSTMLLGRSDPLPLRNYSRATHRVARGLKPFETGFSAEQVRPQGREAGTAYCFMTAISAWCAVRHPSSWRSPL